MSKNQPWKKSDDAYLREREGSRFENVTRAMREKMVLCQLELIRPKNVLEIGSADCRLATLIENTFLDIHITATDRSYELLSYNYGGDKELSDTDEKGTNSVRVMRRVVTDARALPFKNGSYDMIITISCFKHIFSVEKAIEEWKRVLKDGGHLLIIEPSLTMIKVGAKFNKFDMKGIANPWSVKKTKDVFVKSSFEYVRGGYFDLIGGSNSIKNIIFSIFGLIRLNRLTLYQYTLLKK
jgi:ubiquinone/menaquinone biosynthesis C-methylase UbiE